MLVVVVGPLADHDLGLGQRVEEFAAEQFVAETAVVGLDVGVLPRRAGFDEGGLCSLLGQPVADFACGELGAVVGANKGRAPYCAINGAS